MTAVYVLRHPETTWNADKRYQGRLESNLSEEGRRQARLVCDAFSSERLDAVISSPLKRALHLGSKLAEVTQAPITTDQRLTEIGQCPWEGFRLSEIQSRHPHLFDQWYDRPDTVTFPEGETLVGVRARAVSVLRDAFSRHPTGHVALVTHSVVIQVIVSTVLSLDLRYIHHIRISNAGITTLCGTELPGSLLELNSSGAVYGSPIAGANAQQCATWRPRKMTQ